MPFERDDLETLVERARADIKSRLEINGAIVRRSTADILATVNAGTAHLSYGALDFLALQLFIDTANRENLIRLGSFWGLTPNPATFASGTVAVTGAVFTVVLSGTVVIRDDAAQFETTAAVFPNGGTVSAPVVARVAGDAGNTEVGAILELQSPIANVESELPVESPGLIDGNDEETTEDFRDRVLQFLRSSPSGGSDSDYVKFTLEVFPDAQVWVFANTPALGQVTVLFVRVDPDGTINAPTPGEIIQVQAKLDDERPTTAEVFADGPTITALLYELTIDPDSLENRAAVEAELDSLHADQAEAGDGIGRGTIFLSQVYAAVGRAPLDDFTVIDPGGNSVPALFELLTRGAIMWTP